MSTESCSSQAERTVSISGIWLDALSRYKAETGIDLKEEQAGEYRLLAECDSLESALRLTAGLVDAPSLAQASSWKQTQDSLCKVFKLVLVFNDATAELVASLQVPGGKAIFVALGILLKTAQNMQDRLSALADLLCNFDQFFRRLDVRRGIRYPVHDHEILTEICAEFLHVLALAQKIVGDRTPSRGPLGRLPRIRRHISNFREALLDNEDIKSAMRRLDNLTQMELQMTVAQTLHVAADSRVTLQDVQSTSRATLAIVRECASWILLPPRHALRIRRTSSDRGRQQTRLPRYYVSFPSIWKVTGRKRSSSCTVFSLHCYSRGTSVQ
ncbi:hypothetical protein B0H13DRAFT_1132862 [Mycena leptocephala]|nr:hypothetical protein B0H13DRAFT_1132862 [Mycena leptocephala]